MAWANGVRREPSQAAICGMRETSQAAICGMRDVEGGDAAENGYLHSGQPGQRAQVPACASQAWTWMYAAGSSSMQLKKLLAQHPELRSGGFRGVRWRQHGLRRAGGVSSLASDGSAAHARHRERGAVGRVPVFRCRRGVGFRGAQGSRRGRMRRAHPPASVAGQRRLRVRSRGSVDSMTINLATYQVKVWPASRLDLTYLEYALLARFYVDASGAHVLARRAAASRVGFRLLRRQPYGRRPRPSCPRQAGPRSFPAPGDGPRCRLPLERLEPPVEAMRAYALHASRPFGRVFSQRSPQQRGPAG